MDNCMVFQTQIASIMEVLANAAVTDICKLVDDDYAVFRLEITQNQKENRALRRKLQLLELKVARERAERTMRERVLASRPSSVKILDRYRGIARGEGHLTGGHRSFVKPARHNTWKDDQPITVDEGNGTSTQHVIVIESADTEAAGPGVKQERSEREEDLQHSRNIQTGAAGASSVATKDPTTAPAQTSAGSEYLPWWLQFCPMLQLMYGLGKGEVGEPCILRNTTKPHCFLTQCRLNPEGSRTYVSEETPYTW
ncbi:uncharacterized protein LOC115145711 isoform X2 [Oncorhynchus nerka]|uniref:uncharacterized protein LOC115145711 isoform X2 n=1 Tax=Oncorhynchus nerka TaxID=8023 RepID=UPI0031B8A310